MNECQERSWQFIMHKAYCSNCRERKEILDVEEGTAKNGRKLLKGKCASCGEEIVITLSGSGAGTDNGSDEAPPGNQ